ARVHIFSGSGQIVVNRRPVENYFGRPTSRMIIQQPFDVTGTAGQFDVSANVDGGGVSAQAAAVRHGITRALILANAEYRPALKKAGYVTRDPREVERKKYGRHKASTTQYPNPITNPVPTMAATLGWRCTRPASGMATQARTSVVNGTASLRLRSTR